MRRIDRTQRNSPAYFSSGQWLSGWQQLQKYFDGGRSRMEQEAPPQLDNVLRSLDVQQGLSELFAGKCAFCERSVTTYVHRFRPSTEATPFKSGSKYGHVYYAWLSECWDNLYPICDECRPHQTGYFPVSGERVGLPRPADFGARDSQLPSDGQQNLQRLYRATLKEKPVLLDPCRDPMKRHIAFTPYGTVVERSRRGRETIAHFNLDRPSLVEHRASVFRDRINRVVEAAEAGGIVDPEALLGRETEEFVGAWQLLWAALCESIAASLELPSRPEAIIAALAEQRDPRGMLENASEDVALRLEAERPKTTSKLPLSEEPPPRLTSVELCDFKAIANIVLELPEPTDSTGPVPSLLILGENSAGKSSILEAIALAMAPDDERNALDLIARRYVLDPTFMGWQDMAQRRRALVTLNFDDGQKRVLTITQTQFSVAGASNLLPIMAYGPYRHFLDVARQPKPIRSLFESDWVLGNPERWLMSLSDQVFSLVIQRLRIILSIEGDFEVIERDLQNDRCVMVQSLDSRVLRSPLSTVSSGYRAVLAMACDILRQLLPSSKPERFSFLTARALVLIDEIEAHLHPRWKLQIMRGFREALPQVTFIATSHDPLCLRSMQDGEVRVLRRVALKDGADLPAAVETLVDLPVVSKLTIEQLLTSDLFSLFSSDDADEDIRLAQVGDLMLRLQKGETLSEDEMKTINVLENDIRQALPVGRSEVQRLVQAAVADYLAERRKVTASQIAGLKASTRGRIRQLLEGM